jgi:imidazolonepropionase-like amidohydrolase
MFDYLAVWRSAGIPAMDLLQAMTSHAATLLGLGSTRGSVAPGYAADLIAVAEDPLANTEVLRQVDFVMKDGRVIKDSRSP